MIIWKPTGRKLPMTCMRLYTRMQFTPPTNQQALPWDSSIFSASLSPCLRILSSLSHTPPLPPPTLPAFITHKRPQAFCAHFPAQDRYAGNETSQRLENTQLADMRRELTLVQQQLEIEVNACACCVCWGIDLLLSKGWRSWLWASVRGRCICGPMAFWSVLRYIEVALRMLWFAPAM